MLTKCQSRGGWGGSQNAACQHALAEAAAAVWSSSSTDIRTHGRSPLHHGKPRPAGGRIHPDRDRTVLPIESRIALPAGLESACRRNRRRRNDDRAAPALPRLSAGRDARTCATTSARSMSCSILRAPRRWSRSAGRSPAATPMARSATGSVNTDLRMVCPHQRSSRTSTALITRLAAAEPERRTACERARCHSRMVMTRAVRVRLPHELGSNLPVCSRLIPAAWLLGAPVEFRRSSRADFASGQRSVAVAPEPEAGPRPRSGDSALRPLLPSGWSAYRPARPSNPRRRSSPEQDVC